MSKDLNKDTLIKFFSDGCKPKRDWMIGTEHEKFGFRKNSLQPIDFKDIKKIFMKLSNEYGWKKIYECKKLISLKKNNASITLEPGGQIELSGAPMKNLFETCKEVNQHQTELDDICNLMKIDFLGMGVLPKWNRDQIKLMPKKRYKIMSKYMPKVGSKGLDMMFRTATIQANFDFSSEKDMIMKMRISQSLQPLIIALYANSPFIDNKLTNYMSFRSHIWTKTDKKRCGLLKFVYDDSFSFERYVDYLLDIPMYFVIRDGRYIEMTKYSFKDFLKEKEKSIKIKPIFDDWKTHLTTVFPEVRLKNFIEIRGADGGPWSRVCALPAFWTGILYDAKNLSDIWLRVKNWKFNQIVEFYENTRKFGLKTKTPDGQKLLDFVNVIVNNSEEGLKRRKIILKGEDESIFLEPLKRIIQSGKSPAEMWKKLFIHKWENNIDMLYKTNYFKTLHNEKL